MVDNANQCVAGKDRTGQGSSSHILILGKHPIEHLRQHVMSCKNDDTLAMKESERKVLVRRY